MKKVFLFILTSGFFSLVNAIPPLKTITEVLPKPIQDHPVLVTAIVVGTAAGLYGAKKAVDTFVDWYQIGRMAAFPRLSKKRKN